MTTAIIPERQTPEFQAKMKQLEALREECRNLGFDPDAPPAPRDIINDAIEALRAKREGTATAAELKLLDEVREQVRKETVTIEQQERIHQLNNPWAHERESFGAFADRQRCPWMVTSREVGIRSGEDLARAVFANGAVAVGENHFEPPTDARQLATVQLEYVSAMLKKEIKAFSECRASALNQWNQHRQFPNLPPGVGEGVVAELKAGQARIAQLREQKLTLEAKMRDPAAEQRQQAQQQTMDAQFHRLQALAAEVAGVTVQAEDDLSE